MADTGKPNLLWVLITGLAVGVAAASLLVPIHFSDLPSRWFVDPSRSFWLGGGAEAAMFTNPEGMRVAQYSGKYMIMWDSTTMDDIASFASDPAFISAADGAERFIVYRAGGRSVLFVANATLKQALTLSREKSVAALITQQGPRGVEAVSEEGILGRSWLQVVADYWIWVIMGSALLYIVYVVAYGMLGGKGEEE